MDQEVNNEEVKIEEGGTLSTDEVNKEPTAEEVFYPDTESKEESEEPAQSESTENESDGAKESEDEKEQEESEGAKDEGKDTDYNLELSEDSLLDNSSVEDVMSFAKENNLSKTQAQEVLSKQEAAVQKWKDEQLNLHQDSINNWREEVINDRDYGGENLQANSEKAKRVVERFGSEGFKDLLRDSSYGDNPEVFKFLVRVGKAMDSDVLHQGKGQGRPSKSLEELFYGN
jgi:hypothetical protein